MQMRLTTKITIFFAALLLSLLSFNLIASTSIDIIKVGKKAGMDITANVLAREEAARHHPGKG